jgi:MscS family membrane protein
MNIIFAVAGAFGLDRIPPLTVEVLGHPLWQYLATIVYFLLGLVAAWLTDRFFLRWQLTLEQRSGESWRRNLVRLARRPAALVVFLWIFNAAARGFVWFTPLVTVFGHVCTVTAAVIITLAIFTGINLVAGRARRKLEPEEYASYLPVIAPVANVAKVFVVIVAVVVTTQNLGVEVGGLLTTLGIGGAAMALAAQDTLANFFGCVVLLADRPFHVGDEIRIETLQGRVERIGLRSTRLRTAEGLEVTVPNRTLALGMVHNLSRKQ